MNNIDKLYRVIGEVDARRREISRVSRALIVSIKLEENALVAIKLNSEPARNLQEAVERFVARQAVALSTAELAMGFDMLKEQLLRRIDDLLEGY